MPKHGVFYFYPKTGRAGVWEIWARSNGQNKLLPRELYRHLDGQPENNIRFWLDREFGKPEPTVQEDSELTRLVASFLEYLEEHEDLKKPTRDEHKRHLLRDVIPFFLSQVPPLRDPNRWPRVSTKMYAALKNVGHTKGEIKRSNWALLKFWKWMQEEELVLQDNMLVVRFPAKKKTEDEDKTPLEMFMNPDQALKLAREWADKDSDYAIAILLGYFLSMRPEEIFGARFGDIETGDNAAGRECGKMMSAITLYDRLAFHVQRQRNRMGEESPPKKSSAAWVALFNRDAALLLMDLIDGMDDSDRLLFMEANQFYDHWPFDFALKDLRRASLYWLGHHAPVTMQLVHMMKHSRHKSPESLTLYLRRPDEPTGERTKPSKDDL